MAQYMFGTGRLTAMPQGGGAPVQFGALQNVSVDFSADVKELYGRNSFAVDAARGKMKVQGKASTGLVNVGLFNSVFFGQTLTTGQTLVADSEAHTVASGSVTATNGGTFLYDMGVQYASTGVYLTQVPSAPAVGQYSVNGSGVYTFNSSDNGQGVLLTYAYSATSGNTVVINNTLMGSLPTFQVVANGLFKNKQITLTLYACVSNKFALPFKQDDYALSEFDFVAQDNGAGSIGTLTATNT